jgi:hypothetical protein
VVGSPKIMAEQLDHVLTMMALPTVTVQVLPFDFGFRCRVTRAVGGNHQGRKGSGRHNMTNMPITTWRKSSQSGTNAQCVEIANTMDRLRDSKNPHGPALRADLPALLTAIRTGQLD